MNGPRFATRRRHLLVSVLVISLLSLTLAACSSSAKKAATTAGSTGNSNWPKTLVLGEVGEENATSVLQSFAPTAALIQKQLGITIKATAGTSYAAMIEAQEAGKAQLVEYGPFSYWIAVNNGLKIQNIGILLSAPNTDGGYYSEAVVDPKRTPDITSLADAAGKKVCYSDPSSTSGYLYPSYGLLQNNINPTSGVSPVFAGNDSTTALDVYQGICQIGFSNTFNLPTVFTSNHVPTVDLKVIWTSQEIPGNPIAASDSLPASLRSALENLLVNEANSNYLTANGYCSSVTECTNVEGGWGWGPPSDANFTPLGQICAITKSPSCRLN